VQDSGELNEVHIRGEKSKVGKRNDEPRWAKQYFRKRKETGILKSNSRPSILRDWVE
jgi:hypothetical protein